MPPQKIQSVLYVDDDPDICEVVQATLCLIAGLNVRTAGSGEQAIELAYELRPDLVLMDVMMPGLDGPSTLKRMREQAPLAGIPVIFLTAKVLPAEIARLLQLGALGVIGKPFDPLKLCDDVFDLWKRAEAGRAIVREGAGAPSVRAQVDSLTESFLERTRNDIVRLRAIIERAREQGHTALEEAGRIAHSIHGAGAMFGFPEISRTGGAVELLIDGVMSSTAQSYLPSELALLQRLRDLADQLSANVETAVREAPRAPGMFRSGAPANRTESSLPHVQPTLEIL